MILKEQVDRWTAEAGRPLNNFEQMTIARPFVYRNNHWARLIKPVIGGSLKGYVEVDLTYSTVLNRYPLGVRVHSRPAALFDKFTSGLPDQTARDFVLLTNDTFYKWVMFSDLWAIIDDVRLHYLRSVRSHCIYLKDVLKPECYAGVPSMETV